MDAPEAGRKLAGRLDLRRFSGRLSLTQQVALLSLVPIVALGFVLARVLQDRIVSRTLADASESAQLIARIGIQPHLTPRDLDQGLSADGVRELDQQLSARSVTQDLARIKIWNARHEVIYSDDHKLIGRTLPPSDDLEHALEGRPKNAAVVTPKRYSETSAEVGLGQLVEVYVPLRFTASGPPAGAFEIYLSYRPIAAAIGAEQRTIALLISIGLALLWAVLFRIVARTARKLRLQSEENYRLAHYDALTGLPNRTLFIERLAESLREGGARSATTAVLMIDLDGFKEINNTLGEPTGDDVLREVARRLQAQLGEHALVARLGGDEYAVLCPRTDGVEGARATAAALQSSLEAPLVLDGLALNVEASIGIAAMREHSENLDALLQRADVALACAKSRRSRIEVFSPDRDSFDPTRLILLGQVRHALEHGEFVLHYQPKVDLKTMRMNGVEALLRWDHPEHGLLAPPRFVPLVEQTALIAPLTLHVIDQALRQLVAWREHDLHVQMAVNLSARNLLDPALACQIEELLRRHDVPARQLVAEVTESAAMADPERAESVLQALAAAGVGVAIDDFGTGNASIAYLTKLPASEIKIDRSFITRICGDRRAEAIVRSTIDLARHLDLHVVAEGVETQATVERLTELGCDTAQGYLFSRPLPATELTVQLLEVARPTAATPAGVRELRPISRRGQLAGAQGRR